MATQQITSRKQAEDLVIQKARHDDAFRRALVANPRDVLMRTFELRLPPEVKITVLEESDRCVYLVLPAKSAPAPTAELSGNELEMVVGGTGSSGKANFARNLFGSDEGSTKQNV